ncbi:MAG: hypothetical protein WCI51_02325 [Lentisphaerota bacterium]
MAGWTDYADWTSAATLKLTAGYDLLHSIVESINEHILFAKLRSEAWASSLSPLNSLNKLDIYDYRQVYQGTSLQGFQLLNMLSNQVFTALTRNYHNHLRNPITEGLPVYIVTNDCLQFTEASLLAAIGDSERYIVQPLDTEIPVAWAFQMYKALNMLRYTMTRYASTSLFGSITDNRYYKDRNYDGGTFAADRQSFINDSYGQITGGDMIKQSLFGLSKSYNDHRFAADVNNLIVTPVYDCAIYATEYPLNDYIKERKADFFGLGSNKAVLLGNYAAGNTAAVNLPYPDLSLIPAAYPDNGYSNGVFFAAIIDGRSGGDGFEFFAGS